MVSRLNSIQRQANVSATQSQSKTGATGLKPGAAAPSGGAHPGALAAAAGAGHRARERLSPRFERAEDGGPAALRQDSRLPSDRSGRARRRTARGDAGGHAGGGLERTRALL